jgi:hypothetical protein
MPSRSHSSANSAWPATKPHPTQTASADASRRARSSALVVDAAAVERERLVGVADEHRVALGLGVERDDAYRLAAVDVELAHRVDDPHGGLAAVDDRKAREGALHRSAAHRRDGRSPHVHTYAPIAHRPLPRMSCGELRVGDVPPVACGSSRMPGGPIRT